MIRLCAAFLLSLALAGCGGAGSAPSPTNSNVADDREEPPGDESEGVVESGDGRVAAELLTEPEQIATDGEIVIAVANRGEWPLSYGRPITVERWDGEEWTETEESRDAAWTMELLQVEPGETGVEQRWPFQPGHTPEPGWYRFTKSVRADALNDPVNLTLRARVDVTARP